MKARPNQPLSPFELVRSSRGVTLVELMIVVAIIGVLGAIAIFSFTSYVKEGHLTELRQLAMDIERGQESFFSRHYEYLHPEDSITYDDSDPQWTQLLEFSHDLEDHITITVEAEGSCDNACPDGMAPDGEDNEWFAVLAENDDLDVSIFHSSDLSQPMEIIDD